MADDPLADVALAEDTLNAPCGRCFCISSASQSVEFGVFSDGLRTNVLPAASAGANFQIAIMNG